jgi:hypothetical protein
MSLIADPDESESMKNSDNEDDDDARQVAPPCICSSFLL